MKAITLHQPWASLIVLNFKSFETRNWATNFRGELAIHAAKRPVKPAEIDAVVNLISDAKTVEVIKNYDYPFGCVVATCNLIDCITMTPEFIASQSLTERATGDWSEGRFAWRLEEVRSLDQPVPISGQQGLWEWCPEAMLHPMNLMTESC